MGFNVCAFNRLPRTHSYIRLLLLCATKSRTVQRLRVFSSFFHVTWNEQYDGQLGHEQSQLRFTSPYAHTCSDLGLKPYLRHLDY